MTRPPIQRGSASSAGLGSSARSGLVRSGADTRAGHSHDRSALAAHFEPTKRCECEHADHFPQYESADATNLHDSPVRVVILGHAYGVDFPRRHIHAVRTPYGVFNVCPACAQTCYAEYTDDAENQLVSSHDRQP